MHGQTSRPADKQRKTFRQQMLWRKAQDFADSVLTMVAELPRDPATAVIANQTVRSATSIAANIAEGYGRFSQPAYRNHLSIARGSTFETESWLDLLHRRGLISQQVFDQQVSACDELASLLTLRMKSLSEGKSYAVSEEAEAYEA